MRQEPHSLAKGLSENTGGGAGRGLRRWPAWFLGPRWATAATCGDENTVERPDHASTGSSSGNVAAILGSGGGL